jgi:small-conductance mechanosensitive channel
LHQVTHEDMSAKEAEGEARADPESAPAHEIREQKEVQEALEEATPPVQTAPPITKKRDWTWLILFGLLAAALAWLYDSLDPGDFSLSATAIARLRRALLVGALAAFVLCLYRAASVFLVDRLRNRVSRYNLRRVLRLAVGLSLLLIVVSVVFVHWYATAVSFGLISLILGLALQAPITSFFAWIYILARRPYRVGDRIKIGEATGDVIEVGYLDTTLWEFGGELLSTDHPSGRIIKFPNSQIFTRPVYNYSWPLFPYVWNEVKFQVAYESDLDFIAKTMKEVVEEERGPAMAERVRVYRELLAETPVDHLQVHDRPAVLFRVNEVTWLDAIVRYVVDPRRAGAVKTELIRKLLARLNAAPDRVLFPKANAR